jgi:predicted chitinase
MSIPMPTRAQMQQWAPNAKPAYIEAFLNLEELITNAGLLAHPLNLCHFLGQVGAETDGLRIIRENMNYQSVNRIRQVWPARTRKCSDAQLQALVNNPKGLSDFAYGGRMGNRKGTIDGYQFRGAGPMQTTGRGPTLKYCQLLGLDFKDDILDDVKVLWLFAIYEWSSRGCASYAMQNDILSVSKIINTGSATSGIAPNGLDHRKKWLKRAWALWGDARPIAEVSTIDKATLKKDGSETILWSDLLKKGGVAGAAGSLATGAASESGKVVTVPVTTTTETVQQANDALRTTNESVTLGTEFFTSIKGFWLLLSTNLWVLGLVLAGLAYWVSRKIDWRRLIDARLGLNLSRLDQIPPVDDQLLSDPDEAVIPRG